MSLDKCVKRYGKTYCWDSEKREIVEIITRPIDTASCPKDVIFELMHLVEISGGAAREPEGA
jgi:hypothetical protein